jgi:hypothetical protein
VLRGAERVHEGLCGLLAKSCTSICIECGMNACEWAMETLDLFPEIL